jgi:hypothetical protein
MVLLWLNVLAAPVFAAVEDLFDERIGGWL